MRRTGCGFWKALPLIVVLSFLSGCVTAFYIRDFETEIYRASYTFHVTPNAAGVYAGDPVRLAQECQLLTQTDSFQRAVLENVQSDGATFVEVESIDRTYMMEVSATGPDRQNVQALANGVGRMLCGWLPRALQAQSAREIEPAVLPEEPFQAYRNARIAAVMIGVFAVASLLACCFTPGKKPLSHAASQADAFCLGAVHDTHRSQKRFERKRKRRPDKAGMFLDNLERSIREEVRQLVLMLRTSAGRDGSGSYLLTAMREDAEDGALAVLLSSELAQQGFRVLLVEMDAGRRELSRLLGAQAQFDLYDCLKGRCELSSAVTHTGIPTLSFIDCLHADLPVASIAATAPFAAFVRKVQEHFDFVILHAAPRNDNADAAMLSLATGSTILIARDERHTLDEIETAARELARLGKPARGVIFTRV